VTRFSFINRELRVLVHAQAPAMGKKGIMNQDYGRKYDMGTRALKVHNTLPDTDPGNSAAAEKLAIVTERFRVVAAMQRNGLVDVHASAEEKGRLRRAMTSGPLAHLSKVGRAAAVDDHELRGALRLHPDSETLLAFQRSASTIADAAVAHKDLLVKHGLAVPMLDLLVQQLQQFDAAVELGKAGRTAHVAATAELGTLAREIVATVRLMDGPNRQRFRDNQELLRSWISATKILGSPRPAEAGETADGTAPPSGDVRPAA
jgi:hypothetical protein